MDLLFIISQIFNVSVHVFSMAPLHEMKIIKTIIAGMDSN